MNVDLRPEASADLVSAAEYFNDVSDGWGDHFLKEEANKKDRHFKLSDATAVHVLYFLHRPSIVPSKTHQLGTMVPSYGPVMTFVSRVTQLLCMSFYVVFLLRCVYGRNPSSRACMDRFVCAIIPVLASVPVRNNDDCLRLRSILDVAEDFSIRSIRMQRFLTSTVCKFVSLAAYLVSATTAWGHPGHDASVPQQGLFHWLLSPVHCISVVCGATFAAFLVVMLRKMYFVIAKRNLTENL